MFKGAELNRKHDCSLGEVNFVKVKVFCFKNAKIKVMASFANWRKKYLCHWRTYLFSPYKGVTPPPPPPPPGGITTPRQNKRQSTANVWMPRHGWRLSLLLHRPYRPCVVSNWCSVLVLWIQMQECWTEIWAQKRPLQKYPQWWFGQGSTSVRLDLLDTLADRRTLHSCEVMWFWQLLCFARDWTWRWRKCTCCCVLLKSCWKNLVLFFVCIIDHEATVVTCEICSYYTAVHIDILQARLRVV